MAKSTIKRNADLVRVYEQMQEIKTLIGKKPYESPVAQVAQLVQQLELLMKPYQDFQKEEQTENEMMRNYFLTATRINK